MVYVEDAFAETETVEEASVVPVHVFVVVLKPAVAHTVRNTVSGVPETSASDDVLVKVTTAPGSAGELSLKIVNDGLWLISNGDELVAFVPCE
jgi:hypothetical protein